MTAGIKANVDGSAAIQVGGTDVITLTSGGAATFVTSPTTVQAGTAAAPSITFSGDTNTGIYSPGADTIAFTEGGVESGRFDSSGNWLVGTSTATYGASNRRVIELNGTTDSLLNFKRGDANSFYIHNNSTSVDLVNTQNTPIVFATNSVERARITSGGDLLVACTSSTNTASTGSRLYTDGAVWSTMAASTNGGGSGWLLYSTGAAANRFYVGLGGTVFATSTTITAISDIRFKENIQDIDAGLDKILELKPRKFDWKEGKGKDKKGDRGWIAQEFEQVFPEMIDTWLDPAPEGEEPYKAVNADLIPVLVKAIQELKAELDATKAKVAALEGA